MSQLVLGMGLCSGYSVPCRSLQKGCPFVVIHALKGFS